MSSSSAPVRPATWRPSARRSLNRRSRSWIKQWLGGVCLNVGCIPSKSLLKNAEVAHILRERGKDFGFSFENLKLDYGVAVKRSRQNSDRLVKGVGFLMKKNNITVYMGDARRWPPRTLSRSPTRTKQVDRAHSEERDRRHRGNAPRSRRRGRWMARKW